MINFTNAAINVGYWGTFACGFLSVILGCTYLGLMKLNDNKLNEAFQLLEASPLSEGFFVISILCVVVGLLECLAIFLRDSFLNFIALAIILLVFMAGVTFPLFGFQNSHDTKVTMKLADPFLRIFTELKTAPKDDAWRLWFNMEVKLKCCGPLMAAQYSDDIFPESCCGKKIKKIAHAFDNPCAEPYEIGCHDATWNLINQYLNLLLIFRSVCLVIMMLGLLCLVLRWQYSKNEEPSP